MSDDDVLDAFDGEVLDLVVPGTLDEIRLDRVLALYPQMRALSEEGLCDPMRPGIVHRLDKGTSGVLVVAKTPTGYSNLSIQLAERLMERTYYGMVEGHVTEERGVVDAPIGRSTRTPTLMAVRADGRAARTGYEVMARIDKPHAMTS